MIKNPKKFCPNCGAHTEDMIICPDCNIHLDEKSESNFLKDYKIPLIAIAVSLVILVVLIAATSLTDPILYETQEVSVGHVDFEIPADFYEDSELSEVEYEDGVRTEIKGWTNDEDIILIGILDPYTAEDEKYSEEEDNYEMFGHNGYLEDLGDGDWGFSFTTDDKYCVVSVSDKYLFDEINLID